MSHPAESLEAAVNTLQIQPLQAEDKRYTNLAAARGSKVLTKLQLRLLEASSREIRKLHLGFIGHQGSGKTTELLRLEDNVRQELYPVHLYLDQALHHDADYPDVFLWLIEQLARSLAKDEVKLDPAKLEKVANWFTEVTKTEESGTSAKIEANAELEMKAKYGIFGTGIAALFRIKSAFIGSTERRTKMRSELKRYAQELLVEVNAFLRHASDALAASGKPRYLLLVQDNLDRLSREAALNIFRDNGRILTELEAIFIWTAPVGSQMAPFNIENLFNVSFMPTIAVHSRTGEKQSTAIDGLRDLVAKRLNIELLFDKSATLEALILASGGSIRDLLRLIDAARLNAVVEDHTIIEGADAHAGIKDFSLALQRVLIPGNVYFPILAEVAVKKRWIADEVDGVTAEAVDARRGFFHQLILEGAILEYNGEETWHDVHPTLHEVRLFCEEFEKQTAVEEKKAKGAAKRSSSHGSAKGKA